MCKIPASILFVSEQIPCCIQIPSLKFADDFPGKIVRKDLTSLMKKGANVPAYVLEYLLGMCCATDDEDAIEIGVLWT